MTFLSIFRTVLYSVAIAFSLLTVALAAGQLAVSATDWNFFYTAIAELIAAGAVCLIILPILHFVFHRSTSDSFASSVWFELVILTSLWLLLLGGGAAQAAANGDFTTLNFDQDFSGVHDAIVPLTQATEAMAFLGFLTIFALDVLVFVVACVNQSRGHKHAWTRQLAFGKATREPGTTPILPAHHRTREAPF